MLQIAVDWSYLVHPSLMWMVRTGSKSVVQDRIDILLDAHGRAVLSIAGQTAGSDHSPESFFLHKKAGLIRQGVGDSVVLMAGMHHDVGTVERRPFGIVI